MPVMRIVNNYPYPIYVFISKYTTPKGSDDWFYLPVGASETWIRQDGWEVVVAKNEDDTWRQGQYQRTDGADRELLDGGSFKLESSEGEVVDQSGGLEGLSIMSLPE